MLKACSCRSHLDRRSVTELKPKLGADCMACQSLQIPLVCQCARYICRCSTTPRARFICVPPRVVVVAQLHVTSATKKQRAHANCSVALLTGEAHASVVKHTRHYRHSGVAAALPSSPLQNHQASGSKVQGAWHTCCSNAAQFRRVPSTADAKTSKLAAAEAAPANSTPAPSRDSDICGSASGTPCGEP